MPVENDVFFIDNPFYITQNTQLYTTTPISYDIDRFEYIINIDIADTFTGGMNQLFNNRHFKQNVPDGYENNLSIDPNNPDISASQLVDISMSANTEIIRQLLFTDDCSDIYSTHPQVISRAAYSTLIKGQNKLIGLRFLEIVAIKIFGHARARAAIENDADFYSNAQNYLIHQIALGIDNAVSNKANDIFKLYVSLDRVQDQANLDSNLDGEGEEELDGGNDVDDWETFNFYHTNWEFPVFLTGQVLTDISSANNYANIVNNGLANGPLNVGNTTSNTNQTAHNNSYFGAIPGFIPNYNVPILLRFYSSVYDDDVTAVAITTQPDSAGATKSVDLSSGTADTLSLTATGDNTYATFYQWQTSVDGSNNWTNITGAKYNIYTIPNGSFRLLHNFHYFRCIVSNSASREISNSVRLLLNNHTASVGVANTSSLRTLDHFNVDLSANFDISSSDYLYWDTTSNLYMLYRDTNSNEYYLTNVYATDNVLTVSSFTSSPGSVTALHRTYQDGRIYVEPSNFPTSALTISSSNNIRVLFNAYTEEVSFFTGATKYNKLSLTHPVSLP